MSPNLFAWVFVSHNWIWVWFSAISFPSRSHVADSGRKYTFLSLFQLFVVVVALKSCSDMCAVLCTGHLIAYLLLFFFLSSRFSQYMRPCVLPSCSLHFFCGDCFHFIHVAGSNHEVYGFWSLIFSKERNLPFTFLLLLFSSLLHIVMLLSLLFVSFPYICPISRNPGHIRWRSELHRNKCAISGYSIFSPITRSSQPLGLLLSLLSCYTRPCTGLKFIRRTAPRAGKCASASASMAWARWWTVCSPMVASDRSPQRSSTSSRTPGGVCGSGAYGFKQQHVQPFILSFLSTVRWGRLCMHDSSECIF